MNAVRIRRKLDSETLHLPELKPLLGKLVKITIEEEGISANAEAPSAQTAGLSTTMDSDCFNGRSVAKPLDAAAKKALRELLTPEQFEALVEVVGQGGPDVEAILKFQQPRQSAPQINIRFKAKLCFRLALKRLSATKRRAPPVTFFRRLHYPISTGTTSACPRCRSA
jgi:hypothetical protein